MAHAPQTLPGAAMLARGRQKWCLRSSGHERSRDIRCLVAWAFPGGSADVSPARRPKSTAKFITARSRCRCVSSTLGRLAAVAQSCGNPVDRQMDALDDALVGVAGAVALQQLKLHVIERIDVGKAVADSAGERRVAFQQCA